MSSRAPYAKVTVGGVRERRFIKDIELLQGDAEHVLALVTVLYPIPKNNRGRRKGQQIWRHTATLWKANSTVDLVFGARPNSLNHMYGYVAAHEILGDSGTPSSGDVGGLTVRYTVIGTSMPMQSQKNVTWREVTASYIATRIAKQNGLKPVVHPHSRIFPYRVQAAQSDFSFLRDLAAEVGYRFWVNNSVLYFVNPYILLDKAGLTKTPLLRMDKVPGWLDNLHTFHPIAGETVPDGGIRATRKIVSINPQTNALVTATTAYLRDSAFNEAQGEDPLLTVYYRDKTAYSYEEAMSLLAGDQNRNRHWITAKATTDGDPKFRPGGLVNIQGLAIDDDNLGPWVIQKVSHRLTFVPNMPLLGDYFTDLELGRDQMQSATFRRPPAWDDALREPNTVAVNGKWRAEDFGGDTVAR